MIRLYHQLNGHEFEQTLGDSEGQRSLACCSPWGCKDLVKTEHLNNTETWSLYNAALGSAKSSSSKLMQGTGLILGNPKMGEIWPCSKVLFCIIAGGENLNK